MAYEHLRANIEFMRTTRDAPEGQDIFLPDSGECCVRVRGRNPSNAAQDTYWVVTEELLGEGSFGNVFKAYPLNLETMTPSLDKPFAVKVYKDPSQFKQEELDIMQTFFPRTFGPISGDVSNGEHLLLVVTEFLPGKDIFDYTREELAQIPTQHRLRIAADLLDQLLWIHSNKSTKPAYVHSDIKPENVRLYVGEGGNTVPKAFIFDFGLSKQIPDHLSAKMAECIVGSACYFPPEYVDIQSPQVSNKVDVYAMAAVLFRLFGVNNPVQNKQQNYLSKRRELQLETNPEHLNEQFQDMLSTTAELPYDTAGLCDFVFTGNPIRWANTLEVDVNDILKRFLLKMASQDVDERPTSAVCHSFFVILWNLSFKMDLLSKNREAEDISQLIVEGEMIDIARLYIILLGHWNEEINQLKEIAALTHSEEGIESESSRHTSMRSSPFLRTTPIPFGSRSPTSFLDSPRLSASPVAFSMMPPKAIAGSSANVPDADPLIPHKALSEFDFDGHPEQCAAFIDIFLLHKQGLIRREEVVELGINGFKVPTSPINDLVIWVHSLGMDAPKSRADCYKQIEILRRDLEHSRSHRPSLEMEATDYLTFARVLLESRKSMLMKLVPEEEAAARPFLSRFSLFQSDEQKKAQVAAKEIQHIDNLLSGKELSDSTRKSILGGTSVIGKVAQFLSHKGIDIEQVSQVESINDENHRPI